MIGEKILREFVVTVHLEDGMYWGEVDGLDGCFAGDEDWREFVGAQKEAIELWIEDQEDLGDYGNDVEDDYEEDLSDRPTEEDPVKEMYFLMALSS